MAAIIGFTDFLDDANLNEEEKSNYINIIKNSGNQLLSIVNSILDISQIEIGEINIANKEFNLNEFIGELFTFFRAESRRNNKANIELRIFKDLTDEESRVCSDRMRVYQILSNLIKNAFKFTSSGSIEYGYCISSQLSFIENIPEIYTSNPFKYILFYVKDTGIGISVEDQDLIFNRFRQIDISSSRKYGGTGLGLSIAKGLVQALGGNIWVESEKDKGSVFYFTIPYKKNVELSRTKQLNNH